MDKILEIRDLTFTYENNNEKILRDISFDIKKGEIVFLTGPSGCGKSTLLNIIVGAIPDIIEGKVLGELLLDGRSQLKSYERALIIGNVFQNPRSQFFTTNTTAEMVFPLENYGYSKCDMENILNQLAKTYKLEALLNRDVFSLSSGERQKVALASSLVLDPKLLIFDEPSANLDYGNIIALKKEILKLSQAGKGILVADHRCFYLMDIVDKILYIEDGTVTQFSNKEYMQLHLSKRQWDLFNGAYPKPRISKRGESALIIEKANYPPILEDINLELYKNEITIIVGANGAGKTTLARLMTGGIKQKQGKIFIDTLPFYVMQDAEFQLFGHSCDAELKISSKDEKLNIESLEKMSLLKHRYDHPQELSGGEKQRLQLAITYTIDRDLIILDEPTSGLDSNSMDRLVSVIEELAVNKCIIIISHDYEFIRKIGQRVIYMVKGRIDSDFSLSENGIDKLNTIFKEMESLYEE